MMTIDTVIALQGAADAGSKGGSFLVGAIIAYFIFFGGKKK